MKNSTRYIAGLFLLLSSLVASGQQCVYESRTVTTSDAEISERSEIRRVVTDAGNGNRVCRVDFSVRINQDWHMATGVWEWSGDRPQSQACARAVQVAEQSVIDRVSSRNLSKEQVLVCNDDERYEQLTNISVGTVGSIEQFEPHPEYDKSFYHNGAECRWFLDPAFTGTDIKRYEGVICQTRPGKWVVVDQF